jgi:ParB family chromosome partitioning protein
VIRISQQPASAGASEGGCSFAPHWASPFRRFHAAHAVAEETGEAEPLPCAIIEAGDDAAALEASLIENVARLDPDRTMRPHSKPR